MKNIYKNLDLEIRPETYKTLLKEEYGNNTETSKLRRKMSNFTRTGRICSRPISCLNRGRDNIFYLIEKEYFIVYTKTSCYYCENVEHKNDKIYLTKAYELNCVDWVSKNNLYLDVKEVLICF